MKNWKKCPLFLLLLVSGLVITGAGYAGEHSIYAAYSKPDGWMTPGLSLVFRDGRTACIHWELFGNSDASQTVAEAGADTEGSVLQETQALENVRTRRKCRNLRETQATQASDNGSGQAGETVGQCIAEFGQRQFPGGDGLVSGNSVQPMYDKFGKLINQPAPEQIKQEIPWQIPDGGGVSENQVPAGRGGASPG